MLRISKRADLPKNREAIIRAIAIILSIVCAEIVIKILGFNQINVLS